MRLQYYSWIKERLALQEETIDLEEVSLTELLQHLCAKGDKHNYVFSKPDNFCISINNQLINMNLEPLHLVRRTDEVAFFPPISGG